MRSRRALRYSSAGLFGAVGDEVCRATLRKAQGLFRERVRWTTALAWISSLLLCPDHGGATVNVVDRAASG